VKAVRVAESVVNEIRKNLEANVHALSGQGDGFGPESLADCPEQ